MSEDILTEAERLTLELEKRISERESEAYREPDISLLTFHLGSEWYAVNLEQVKVVSRLLEVTPVPGASRYVLGVINYRSSIYPLVDLHQLLDIAPALPSRSTRLVIVNHERDSFALLVDSSTEVKEVRQQDFGQQLESNRDVTQLVTTEINVDGKLLGLLNVEAIYRAVVDESGAASGTLRL